MKNYFEDVTTMMAVSNAAANATRIANHKPTEEELVYSYRKDVLSAIRTMFEHVNPSINKFYINLIPDESCYYEIRVFVYCDPKTGDIGLYCKSERYGIINVEDYRLIAPILLHKNEILLKFADQVNSYCKRQSLLVEATHVRQDVHSKEFYKWIDETAARYNSVYEIKHAIASYDNHSTNAKATIDAVRHILREG